MAASDLVNLSSLLDDAKCFALVRQHRWPKGVRCPGCDSGIVARDGHDDTQPHRQRCRCKACASRFDDLTGTVLAGRHRPLRARVPRLPFMGLPPSKWQFAGKPRLSASDAQPATAAAPTSRAVAAWAWEDILTLSQGNAAPGSPSLGSVRAGAEVLTTTRGTCRPKSRLRPGRARLQPRTARWSP